MRIEVTQRHIDRGIRCNPRGCALALAFEEAIPLMEASVCSDHVVLEAVFECRILELRLPDHVVHFRKAFDCPSRQRGRKVKPFSFEIDIPAIASPQIPNGNAASVATEETKVTA